MVGATNAADLPDELRFLTTKLAHPAGMRRCSGFRTAAVGSFDLNFSSASAARCAKLGGFIPPERPALATDREGGDAGGDGRAVPRLLRALSRPGPGQRDRRRRCRATETAVEAVRRTVGALPRRPAPSSFAPGAATLNQQAPNPEPRRFTREAIPTRLCLIGWSTWAAGKISRRAALALAAEHVRSPCSTGCASRRNTYAPTPPPSRRRRVPQLGRLLRRREEDPPSLGWTPSSGSHARSSPILAAHPVQPDEFARAVNRSSPASSGALRPMPWLDALEDSGRSARHRQCALLSRRLPGADFEDVRSAVATYVTDQETGQSVLPAEGAATAAATRREWPQPIAPFRFPRRRRRSGAQARLEPVQRRRQPWLRTRTTFWILQSIWLGRLFLFPHSPTSPMRRSAPTSSTNALLTAAAYSITLLMASAYRRRSRCWPLYTSVGSILIVRIAAAALSAIETWSFATFVDQRADRGPALLRCDPLPLSLLIAWSARYSINFFILLEEAIG